MSERKELVYEAPEAEIIRFNANDNFLVTSGGGGSRRSERACNFDVCFGVDWTCVIDRWLFGD